MLIAGIIASNRVGIKVKARVGPEHADRDVVFRLDEIPIDNDALLVVPEVDDLVSGLVRISPRRRVVDYLWENSEQQGDCIDLVVLKPGSTDERLVGVGGLNGECLSDRG